MIKICMHCSVAFDSEDKRAKYCSRACYDDATGRPDAFGRICDICGNSFDSYDPGSKYCSQDCYNQSRAIQPRKCPRCGKMHTPKDNRVKYCSRRCSKLRLPKTTCDNCHRSFRPRTKSKSKFCSLECYHESMSSQYPRSRLNFSAREKRIILKRDNHQCVKCSATDNLEIDHILAICNGGKRSIANGQTLCSKCHTKKTKRDKALARKRKLN